jgi:hypothetical protein
MPPTGDMVGVTLSFSAAEVSTLPPNFQVKVQSTLASVAWQTVRLATHYNHGPTIGSPLLPPPGPVMSDAHELFAPSHAQVSVLRTTVYALQPGSVVVRAWATVATPWHAETYRREMECCGANAFRADAYYDPFGAVTVLDAVVASTSAASPPPRSVQLVRSAAAPTGSAGGSSQSRFVMWVVLIVGVAMAAAGGTVIFIYVRSRRAAVVVPGTKPLMLAATPHASPPPAAPGYRDELELIP